MSASLKCGECGLVQFVGDSASCARCGAVWRETVAPSIRPAATALRVSTPSTPPTVLTAASLGLEPRRAPLFQSDVNPWTRRLQLMALSGVSLVVLAFLLSLSYRAAKRYLYADVEGAVAPTHHVSHDGVLSLTTPPSFVERRSARNKSEVVLELESARGGAYVVAVTLSKAQIGRVVTLSQVANAGREGLVGLGEFELGRSSDVRLAEHDAIEIPFHADHDHTKSRGLLYVVDGDGYYHVLFVGSSLARFARDEPMLRDVVTSARFHFH